MLFRPDSGRPAARARLAACLLLTVLLTVALAVGAVVLRSQRPPQAAPPGGRPAAGMAAAADRPAGGWNLHDGGLLGTQTVVPPAAAPDGAGVPGPGQAPRAAGPGDYTGFPPVSLVLPSGRRAAIRPAGVRNDGTLAVPDDPSAVGWWTGGAQPGERYGGVVLAGHVDSRQYGLGAMAEMLRVRPGAVIAVDGPAGQRVRYHVTRVRQVAKARLAAGTGAFDQAVPGRLVLITCGGPFDPRLHHYRDNVVLLADPVRSADRTGPDTEVG